MMITRDSISFYVGLVYTSIWFNSLILIVKRALMLCLIGSLPQLMTVLFQSAWQRMHVACATTLRCGLVDCLPPQARWEARRLQWERTSVGYLHENNFYLFFDRRCFRFGWQHTTGPICVFAFCGGDQFRFVHPAVGMFLHIFLIWNHRTFFINVRMWWGMSGLVCSFWEDNWSFIHVHLGW